MRNDGEGRSRSKSGSRSGEGQRGLSGVLKVDRVLPDRIERVVGGKGGGFGQGLGMQKNVSLGGFDGNLGQV